MPDSHTIHHAYLYSGPTGSGKTKAILEQASKLLESRPDRLDSHPDFFRTRLAEDKKEISVSEIKTFTRMLSSTPVVSSRRVGVLEDGDTMSLHAANALLKTLEEPRGSTVIFIAARDKTKILDTILSRVVEVVVTQSANVRSETPEEQQARDVATQVLASAKHGRLLGLEKQYEKQEVHLLLGAFEKLLRDNMLRAYGLFDMVTDSTSPQGETKGAVPPTMWNVYFSVIEKCRQALERNAVPKTVLENCILSLPQV